MQGQGQGQNRVCPGGQEAAAGSLARSRGVVEPSVRPALPAGPGGQNTVPVLGPAGKRTGCSCPELWSPELPRENSAILAGEGVSAPHGSLAGPAES